VHCGCPDPGQDPRGYSGIGLEKPWHAVGRIEGLITRFPSSSYFEVDGQPVAVDSRTKLHLHGPLGLDVAVKVTGTFDVNGVLVASKVKDSK
jgi:hypothetical protein